MSDRLGRLVADLGRFSLVGGLGLVVDVCLFNLLRATVLPDGRVAGAVLIAKSISTVAAILTNWAGNRWWTFRNRRRTRMLPEVLSFIAVSLAGSVIALLCLALSHYVLGYTSLFADNISANVIGLALGSVFRFVAARNWVFSPQGEPAAGADASERAQERAAPVVFR